MIKHISDLPNICPICDQELYSGKFTVGNSFFSYCFCSIYDHRIMFYHNMIEWHHVSLSILNLSLICEWDLQHELKKLYQDVYEMNLIWNEPTAENIKNMHAKMTKLKLFQ